MLRRRQDLETSVPPGIRSLPVAVLFVLPVLARAAQGARHSTG
jgi:hypothetical protein